MVSPLVHLYFAAPLIYLLLVFAALLLLRKRKLEEGKEGDWETLEWDEISLLLAMGALWVLLWLVI
ncbi:MAG: hypothetical protein QW356_05505 [Candidatus Hadarchaeales archaeon]